MFRNHLKIAWRNLVRNKVYAAINIAGLALGISACLVIYLVTSFELSYENFQQDKERIYRVVASIIPTHRPAFNMGGLPHPASDAIREELSGFDNLAIFHNYVAKVTVPAGPLPEKKFDAAKWGESDIVIAEPQYFDIFSYHWLAGSPAAALQEPFKVVLTEAKAYKYFGRRPLDEIIGKTLLYNDSLRLTVSGIVKDLPKNTDFSFQDFISFATVKHSFLKNEFTFDQWGNFHSETQTFVKLSPGTNPSRLSSQFPAFINRHILPQLPKEDKLEFRLQPLTNIHFSNDYRDEFSRHAHLPTLYGLMGIAVFILLIAAINFINLSTAQSIERVKEIGIRKVLGSNRTHLAWQFLSETLLFALLAMLTAVLFARPLLTAFQSFIPKGVTFDLFSPALWLFLGGLIIATTLLAGLYPAKVLASLQPAISLKGASMQKGNQRGALRKGLIVFQFTISLIFIIGTFVVGRQIKFLLNEDMGFAKDAIINIGTNWQYPADKKTLLAEKIRQLPGVEMVCTSAEPPAARGHRGTPLTYFGKQTMEPMCEFELGDEHFVPLYELKIIAGRNVYPSDTMKELLINEACAKALGFQRPEEAIGKFAKSGQNDGPAVKLLPIVGVMADFHAKSLHEPIKPIFFSTSKGASRAISVKLRTNDKQVSHFKTLIADIEKSWKDIYPNEKFEYTFFDETIARLYEKEEKTAGLMNTAMAVSVFISCMGLFGLAAFTARRRTREIGIRKVLGASVANITAMLTKDFVVLVVIALFIASPVAWFFMNKWLDNFAFRITISWWIFIGAGLTAILIAMATVSVQALKAALMNPVKSLRTE